MSTKNKESKIYLTSEEFYNEIIKSKIDGKISDDLTAMFTKLTLKTVNHRNFVRYFHLREDFISIGFLACVYGFEKFRPFKEKERSLEWEKNKVPITYNYLECNNSFAFFTTCIMNAIVQFLKSEYNQSNIVNESRLREGLDASYGYVDMIKEREGNHRDYHEPSDVVRIDIDDEESTMLESDARLE